MIENDDSKEVEVDEDLFQAIQTVTKVAVDKRKSLSKVNKENDNTSYELDTNNKHETMSDEQDTGDEKKEKLRNGFSSKIHWDPKSAHSFVP